MTQPRRLVVRSVLLSVLPVTLACHDLSGLAGKQELPAGTLDPNSVKTADGAMRLYQTELAAFQYSNGSQTTDIGSSQSNTGFGAFVTYTIYSGYLSDELQSPCYRSAARTLSLICDNITQNNWSQRFIATVSLVATDARQVTQTSIASARDDDYTALQGIRGGAGLAIGALGAYAPDASPALIGHMYALKGYAEILLADLYCSGIPLSTIDFNGDFTYRAGSTTAQVYRDAIVQFDSAIAHSADSSRILNFARVGKGRAYLDLGFPDSAALAVVDVPDGFAYQFPVDWTGFVQGRLNVANTKGVNGLPYLTAGVRDPRVTSRQWGTDALGKPVYAPAKYGTAATPFVGTVAPITVADWIEARLIRAEAALAAGNVDEWYTQLHYLRQHGSATVIPDTLPGDTLLNAPTAAGRLAVLFRERAYWLFVTGHRQGDLRRLIRQYHLSPDAVYPTGAFPPGYNFSFYGEDVNFPIPGAEYQNPLFAGCLSRGA